MKREKIYSAAMMLLQAKVVETELKVERLVSGQAEVENNISALADSLVELAIHEKAVFRMRQFIKKSRDIDGPMASLRPSNSSTQEASELYGAPAPALDLPAAPPESKKASGIPAAQRPDHPRHSAPDRSANQPTNRKGPPAPPKPTRKK